MFEGKRFGGGGECLKSLKVREKSLCVCLRRVCVCERTTVGGC